MKFLYSVQRYGERIVGGSESACREFAEHLVSRGHSVDVLTSCAMSYVDWANEYEPGVEIINGVRVIRLPVSEPRNSDAFGKIHSWISQHPSLASRGDQIRWARLMGPQLEGHREWLTNNAHFYDVAVFMTYLYSTTTLGLPTVAGRVPTVLQPTAHDEPAAYVDLFNSIFRQPDAFLFFTPEEKEIVSRLYRIQPAGSVIGIGIEQRKSKPEKPTVCQKYDLKHRQFIVYVGRLDESKGVGELIRFFRSFKDRNKNDVKLVLAGDAVMDIPLDENIVNTGFLSETEKAQLISDSLALVQSSYFESFSIVLCEAWRERRPALVQGRCMVLRGQALRSGGAIPYEGFASFENSLNFLLENPEVADQLGQNGFEYVESQYDWDVVLEKFEETAELAIERFRSRRILTRPQQ